MISESDMSLTSSRFQPSPPLNPRQIAFEASARVDTPTSELYVCTLRLLRLVLSLAADASNGGFTGQNFFEEEQHFVVEGIPPHMAERSVLVA